MSLQPCFLSLPSLVENAAGQIKNIPHEESADHIGLLTGFDAFDAATMGLQPGELIILAGRPGMGKTSLALNIASNASLQEGRQVAYFCMEIRASHCAQRLLSSAGKISQASLRRGKLEPEDWPRLYSSINMLCESNLFFNECPTITIDEVADRCDQFAQERNLGLVIIDYLQLMQLPGSKDHPAAGHAELLRSLKVLARKFNIPVIAVSQIGRGLEMRANKRPCVADVCAFDAFDHFADLYLMLYRDEFYNPDSPDKGIVELSYAHRNQCRQGMIKLRFSAECFRFDNVPAS